MENKVNNQSLPTLKKGYYVSRATPSLLYLVENENLFMHPACGVPTSLKTNPVLKGSLKYGDFGDLHPDVAKEIGQTNANVEITPNYDTKYPQLSVLIRMPNTLRIL